MTLESDIERFDKLRASYESNSREDSGIGTYKEKSLHYLLKNFFCEDKNYHECAYNGFIADILKDDYIVEIQSSSLSGMRSKLDAFLPSKKVRIVFPIISKRTVVWCDAETGETKRSRRSTSENMYVFIRQLVYVLDYLRVENLLFTVVELSVDDYRLLDGRGKYKKIGATKVDTVPVELHIIRDFSFPRDLSEFVPTSLPEVFTREEFSTVTKLKGRALWAVMKVFEEMRIITRTDSKDRKYRYIRGINYKKS